MNINDLQLGDKVFLHNVETITIPLGPNEITSEQKVTDEVITITALVENGQRVGYDKWSTLHGKVWTFFEDIEDIRQIPLNGEILLLNGFKQDESHHWHYKLFETIRVYLDERTHKHIFEWHMCPRNENLCMRVYIRTVDELQHALRLCGLKDVADDMQVVEKENGENE